MLLAEGDAAADAHDAAVPRSRGLPEPVAAADARLDGRPSHRRRGGAPGLAARSQRRPVRARRPPQRSRAPGRGRQARSRRAVAARLAARIPASACTWSSRARSATARKRSTPSRCTRPATRGIPVVASNDVRFLDADGFDAHEARVCISTGRVLDDPKRPHEYSAEQYLKSSEQMAALFADVPDAIDNAFALAHALQPRTVAGHVLPARVPGARRTKRSTAGSAARRAKASTRGWRSSAPSPEHGARRTTSAPGNRARRHHQDGLRRLLPDRRGLHQLGEGPRHPGRPGPWFGRGFAGGVGAGHHRPRPDSATTCCSSASSIPNACRCPTSTSTSAWTAATR